MITIPQMLIPMQLPVVTDDIITIIYKILGPTKDKITCLVKHSLYLHDFKVVLILREEVFPGPTLV